HDHVTTVRPGHGAVNQQQVVLDVDADDAQVADRAALVAVAARHAAPLEGARGKGIAARRAGVAMHFLHAVAGALALVVVPPHDARGAAALRSAGDVDRLDAFQQRDGKLLANRVFRARPIDKLAAELANEPLRLARRPSRRLGAAGRESLRPLAIQFSDMTALGARCQTARLI